MYKKISVVLLSIAMSLECTISSAFACDLPKFNGYNGEEVHLFILWENALKNKVNCKKIFNGTTFVLNDYEYYFISMINSFKEFLKFQNILSKYKKN